MKKKTNLGTLYASFKNELKLSGIKSASIEARILLAHSLNISDAMIIGYPETLIRLGKNGLAGLLWSEANYSKKNILLEQICSKYLLYNIDIGLIF